MATKRIKGSIHEAQHTSDKVLKRNLELATRGPYDWTMYHELGFEGYSQVLCDAMTKQNESKARNAYYLNHGYFKVKPSFSIMKYESTDDPMPKPDKNGNYCGVFQVKDVDTGEEMVLWLYTTPKDRSKWERLHVQIRYIINRVQFLKLDHVDEDGYLPVIIKFGRLPTQFATKYARVIGWDFSTGATPTAEQFGELNHPTVDDMATIGPKFPNEYEQTDGSLRVAKNLKASD